MLDVIPAWPHFWKTGMFQKAWAIQVNTPGKI
jgi:hypothetical protein